MNVNEIVNLVGSVGFPIIMCIYFFNFFTTSYKQEQEKTREIINELKETINMLKVTIEKRSDNDE